jgi:tetratricopeptide (TPR) repeat protein
MKQGRIAEAQEYFERALDYNSSRLFALSFSAFCMMQTAMQTHDRRNLPLAGQRLEQALRFAPDDPDTLTNMALWSFLMSRPKDEETYSRKAIAANPDAIQARLYLGDAFQAQGKLDQAAEENRQVLAIEPDNFYAHNDLGMIFYRQGLTGEALKELRRSLAIKPDQVLPHSEIGRILTETHQFPEAVEEFAQVLRLDPENADAHDDLGVALFQLGDDEMAVEQFSDALRIDPANAGARRNLDLARARMKNKKVEYKRK